MSQLDYPGRPHGREEEKEGEEVVISSTTADTNSPPQSKALLSSWLSSLVDQQSPATTTRLGAGFLLATSDGGDGDGDGDGDEGVLATVPGLAASPGVAETGQGLVAVNNVKTNNEYLISLGAAYHAQQVRNAHAPATHRAEQLVKLRQRASSLLSQKITKLSIGGLKSCPRDKAHRRPLLTLRSHQTRRRLLLQQQQRKQETTGMARGLFGTAGERRRRNSTGTAGGGTTTRALVVVPNAFQKQRRAHAEQRGFSTRQKHRELKAQRLRRNKKYEQCQQRLPLHQP